jgi:D-arabinose 5-phosphate isomerase GutQ
MSNTTCELGCSCKKLAATLRSTGPSTAFLTMLAARHTID